MPIDPTAMRRLTKATDRAVLVMDGSAGNRVKASSVQIDSSGNVTGIQSLSTATDVGIGDGGTGASTATGALANLGIRAAVKTSDETINSSTTLQDDDALTLSVEANANYILQANVTFHTDTVPDFKWEFSGPTGITIDLWYRVANVSGSTAPLHVGRLEAVSSPVSLSISGSAAHWMTLYGAVRNGANAGNLTFRWAQDTSDVADTVVEAYSLMELRKYG